MKHSHDIRHTKDNGSAQDCRHKENYIGRQTRVTRETQLEPLKQWLSNKMGGDRQSTWEHMAPTSHVLNTETSGGQPGHTSRTVTTWLQKILKSETHKLQYLHLYILACALFFFVKFFPCGFATCCGCVGPPLSVSQTIPYSLSLSLCFLVWPLKEPLGS